MMMDSIFGEKNFKNEVAWCYGGRGMSKKRFNRKHDTILFYGKTKDMFFSPEGASRPIAQEHVGRYNKVDNQGRRYARIKNRDGTYSDVYLSDVVREDWWEIPYVRGNESTGYPTQKPLALLERIIKASSNRGDFILDPFCGCATTCIGAERLQRKWIGIDLSPKAVELVKQRLENDLNITEQMGLLGDKVIHRTDIPTREVPDEPRQIHAATLFSLEDSEAMALSQVELRRYKTYKHTLFGLQEGKCNGCEVLFPFRNMTIDHILPRSRGGSDAPDNLQLLCAACNSTKGNRTQEYLIQALRDQGVIREDIEEY